LNFIEVLLFAEHRLLLDKPISLVSFKLYTPCFYLYGIGILEENLYMNPKAVGTCFSLMSDVKKDIFQLECFKKGEDVGVLPFSEMFRVRTQIVLDVPLTDRLLD
jgi:hypothetical protein